MSNLYGYDGMVLMWRQSAFAEGITNFGIKLTLNVAPAADWVAGDIVTGQSSGATCTVVAKVSTLVYNVKYVTGTYSSGEVVGVTGTPTKLADQGTGYPTITNDTVFKAPVKCTMTPVNEVVENPNKTGQIVPVNFSKVAGRGYVNITIEGALCYSYGELYRALTGGAGATYTIQNSTARNYYTIHNVRNDVADRAVDCVMKSLSITGESNGFIMFKAEFMGKAYTDGAATSGLAAYPPIDDVDYNEIPYLFGNITNIDLTPAYNYVSFYSFELALENEFIKEDHLFTNSLALTQIPVIGTTGTFKYTTVYDNGVSLGMPTETEFIDQNLTGSTCQFDLSDGLGSVHSFTINGLISEAEKPDPDRGLFELSLTIDLAGDSSGTEPLKIEIS